ncbi:hypothetical protein K492DRAFT_207590 [Lichtheimia hyalospora FSU 10163]|nr:hypothetical protein K492DRAFT_207590 [Lichtheimia hyalospora FSU 10163]
MGDLDPQKISEQVHSSSGNAALLGSAFTSAIVSIICNILVLITFFFIMWYRPPMVNRVSLRLIVFSCFCNIIYCIFGMPTPTTQDDNPACRVLIYILIATDTMSTMSLAMVGLNLVMIFIVRVTHPVKLEKYYYALIIMSAILATVMPLAVATAPANNMGNYDCWYHYYFVGRLQLLALNKFRHKKSYFVGSLNMAGSAESGVVGSNFQREAPEQRNTPSRAVVFRKVVVRCVGYPIIPLISKMWGVGLEIAAIQNNHIPFCIFVLDMLFSNLLGFMVSLVFFSDPSVIAVIHELAVQLKRRYVDDYFCVDVRSMSSDEEDNDTNDTIGKGSGKFGTGQVSYHTKSSDKRATATFPNDHEQPHRATLNHRESGTSTTSQRSFSADAALMLLHPHTPDSEATSSIASSTHSSQGRKTIMVGALMSQNEITVSATRRSTFPQLPDIKKPSPTLERPQQLHRKRPLFDKSNLEQPSEQSRRPGIHSMPVLDRPRPSFVSSLFPCMTSKSTSDLEEQRKRRPVRSHSVPMHRITASSDNRFDQQFNQEWPLGSEDENNRFSSFVRKRASVSGSLWRSMEDSKYLVEPYSHPRLAMAMHFFLVTVCRIKATDEVDDDQISVEVSESVMPNRKSLAESLSENLNATRRRQSQQQQQQQEGQSRFVRPHMLRGETMDTVSTFGSQMPDNPLLFPSTRKSKLSPDKIQMDDLPKSAVSRKTMSEIKGKAPMRMFHPKETDYFNQPMSPTQTMNDANSDQPYSTAPQQQPSDHFVFTVTDSTSSEPQHQEILTPVRATNNTTTLDAQPSPIRPRPKLLERISEPAVMSGKHAKKQSSSGSSGEVTTASADASGRGSGGGRSILQHVWVRGVSPTSRSFKVAKQIAKRGDSSSTIRSKPAAQQQQPLIITTNTHILSPSPMSSSPSQSPSSYNSCGSSLGFPHHLTARPRSTQPTVAAPRLLTEEQDTTDPTECHRLRAMPHFVAADFGRLRSTRKASEHWLDNSQQQQQEEYDQRLNELRKYQASQRHALDQHHAITVGFSFGVTRSCYVGNWDYHDRVTIVEEQWDIDTLIEKFINAHIG